MFQEVGGLYGISERGGVSPYITLQEGATAPTLSLPAEKSKSPSTHPHHFLQGNQWECADQLHHCLVRELSAADRKTLQQTVNTAAKIIGAPLPSILYIFLAQCSSKAYSIVKDPTHTSHSLFQLPPSVRRYTRASCGLLWFETLFRTKGIK